MKRRLVSCLHSVASLQAYGVQAAKISQSQETNAALGHKKLHPRFIPNYPPSPLHLLHAAPILCDTLQRVYQGLSALDCHLIGAWPVLGPFLGTWTTHGSPFHLWPDLGLELFALLLLFGRLRIHAKLPDLAPAVYPYTSKRHRRSKKNLSRDYALQKRPLADSCVKNTPVSSLFSQAQAISLFLLYTYSSGLVILQVTPRKRPVGSCSELEWPCPGWRVPALLAAGGPVGISPIPFPPFCSLPFLPFDRKRNGPRSQLLVGETMPPSACRGG
ncbi:hypothetical protein CABS01_05929 [Colletotrichum abscissum]|uniref:uncharacterized protein n=1 Tax=Colletotrichum abscissum TaxID=1671311 RepID=UPI0027D4897B|nr:uncharacterized protein CABS01_05929 [Colletotrichum abscissum]KAK1518395.1 hypothetical protein CABS01_05929 [Colletotrichum abscissum]